MNPANDQAMVAKMADSIRILSMDAVETANSGHPGAPMGMAEMAVALWDRHLSHNPSDPSWFNRDRFVLSNGHASMLIYSLLHLCGYDLSLDDIKQFRQLHSKTPGHPECDVTPGVETTTGPLGQGVANAVGMALAEKQLASEFNRDGAAIVDHFTYAFVGDGCLMEGISHEVASLAGTLRLSKLIVMYDDNGISIDGDVEGWFGDDTAQRFQSYGWHVINEVDGQSVDAVDAAIAKAKAQADGGKPTLILCKTVIGQGAPHKAGGHSVHGAPLGAAEISAAKAAMGVEDTPFVLPEGAQAAWDARARGAVAQQDWDDGFAKYTQAHPALAAEFSRRIAGAFPNDYAQTMAKALAATAQRDESVATRKASQQALDILGPLLPEMYGGSADLTGSNLTNYQGVAIAGRDMPGKHLSYGVREFGMAAMMNGMALHGGFIPYGGTFLTFSDYSRNALRMSALMKIRTLHVFTHDSIGLGEDGPTHQSVEHIPSLRIIPGVDVWRPADPLETLVAWKAGVERMDGPTVFALSRQSTPSLCGDIDPQTIAKGGYVLSAPAAPQAVIIGTGTELNLAVQAAARLAAEGVAVQVVSMPSTNVFDRQDASYRQQVLPETLPMVAVEAAHSGLWHKYIGRDGVVVGIDRFGESAPAPVLYDYFNITTERVIEAVKQLLA